MHSDQFKPKSYLKLIKKYVFSEGEQFPLTCLEAIGEKQDGPDSTPPREIYEGLLTLPSTIWPIE